MTPAPSKRLDLSFLVMGLFFVAVAGSEYVTGDTGEGGRGSVKLLSAAQIAFALGSVLWSGARLAITRWLPLSFLLLCSWLCLSGIICTTSVDESLYLWGMYLYWYSLFLYFYARLRLHPEGLQGFLAVAVLSLAVWVPALVASTRAKMMNLDNGYLPEGFMVQNYIGYYIVALFPYALLLRGKALKTAAMAAITFGAAFSLKRGAALALFLMALGASLMYLSISPRRGRGGRALLIALLWCLALVVAGTFYAANAEAIRHRLDQGSNREEVYGSTLAAIGRSTPFDLVAGHGDRQARATTGHFSHNDWLYLLYDYGVVGVLLMLNVYLSLLTLLWRLWRLKSPLSLPLLAAIILMACVQQYSIGLYLKTFGFITGCIGIVAGSYYRQYRGIGVQTTAPAIAAGSGKTGGAS